MSTIEFTEEQLAPTTPVREQIGSPGPIDLWSVIWRCARKHGATQEQVLGSSRLKHVAAARHEVFLALREAGWSFPAIGAAMNRDHTTVMAGVKKAQERAAKARVA